VRLIIRKSFGTEKKGKDGERRNVRGKTRKGSREKEKRNEETCGSSKESGMENKKGPEVAKRKRGEGLGVSVQKDAYRRGETR